MNYKSITKKILHWYDNNKLSMPWRDESDPYKIWLSEIMLQQTQVTTVVRYYNRWIDEFPTIKDVAYATQDKVLKHWQGLGYYARARNFHQSCKNLKNNNYKVPSNVNEFIKLKGVGPYIAHAVQSIAFNIPVAVVDGNVNRVVSRLNSYEVEPVKNRNQIQSFVNKVIDVTRPGDFNQAIMDLGRYICKPRAPLCSTCPLTSQCIAYKNNIVNQLPIKAIKTPKPHHNVVVGIIWYGNKLLITKRKDQGLLGGLWEFPGGKINKNENVFKAVRREIMEELSIVIETKEILDTIEHQYSHFSVSISAIKCEYIKGYISLNGPTDYKWIHPTQLSNLPFPKASSKLFHTIKGN